MKRKCFALLSNAEVLDRLAAVVLTMPVQKTYIDLDVDLKKLEERVTPDTITRNIEFLSRIITAFPRRPYGERLLAQAFRRYRVVCKRARNDAWCAEEAQKLEMVWRWIWTNFKRKPKCYSNDEVKRLKLLLASGGDSSADDEEVSVVADDTGGGGDSNADDEEVSVVASDAEMVYDDDPGSDDCVDVPSDCSISTEDRAESPAAPRVPEPPAAPPRKLIAHMSIASSVDSGHHDASRPVPPPGLKIPSGDSISYDRAEHRQRVKLRKSLKKPCAAATLRKALKTASKKPAGHMLKTGDPPRFRLLVKQKWVGPLPGMPSELDNSLAMKDVQLVEALCKTKHIQLQDESVTEISTKVLKLDQRKTTIRQVKAYHDGRVQFKVQLTGGKFGVHLTKATTLLCYAIRRGVEKEYAEQLKDDMGRLSRSATGLSFEPAD